MNSPSETLKNCEFILRKHADKFAHGQSLAGMAPRVSQDQHLTRRNALSKEEHDKILELHWAGVKATIISQRMQRSPACVSRVVQGKNQKFSPKT